MQTSQNLCSVTKKQPCLGGFLLQIEQACSGVARTFGAHGQRTIRGPSPIRHNLIPLNPPPHTSLLRLCTSLSLTCSYDFKYSTFSSVHILSYVIYMVYFGNLGPFDDTMGEMRPIDDANDKRDPLIM